MTIASSAKEASLGPVCGLCCEMLRPCNACGTDLPVQDEANAEQMLCSCGAEYPSCPECADGWLVERKGRFGKFFGCVNYPKCTGKKRPEKKPAKPKSACDAPLMAALRDHEKERAKAQREEMQSWTNAHALWKGERDRILMEAKKSKGEKRTAAQADLEALGSAPMVPDSVI